MRDLKNTVTLVPEDEQPSSVVSVAPVIAIERIPSAARDTTDFVGFKLSRFWLAEHATGEYVAIEWGTKDTAKVRNIGEFRWRKRPPGRAARVPSPVLDEHGDILISYQLYSTSQWDALNRLLQRVRNARAMLEDALALSKSATRMMG